uniref:peptidoglycan D,D-transpeptidase FtsI family protein n=1 Tax=Rubrimonas sp. TaxID=2036015 RepID=UPI002FDE958D
GRPLAMNLPAAAIYAHPHELDDPAAAAAALAAVLDGVSEDTLRARFREGRRFAWVKRPISPRERQAAHDLGLPGVYFGAREMRLYPAGRIGAHVLGGARFGDESVDFADTVGLAGVEQRYDAALRDPARAGAPLRLSLDLPAQTALTETLRAAMERFTSKAASAVLMEAGTGRIVAMVSLPDFDPNARPNPADPKIAASGALMNRAAGGVFELGSVMKPLFAAFAMEEGIAGPQSALDATGPLVWGRFTIRDFHRMPPRMTLTEVIAESSNVATARLAIALGVERTRAYLDRLGLLSPLEVDLAEASLSRPLTPPRWSELSAITISYGHGLAITPLHLAQAYAAMVNGGLRVRPSFDADAPPPAEADRVFSPQTSARMRAILRAVVTDGTGGFAEAEGYEVAGKTGTADKPKPGGGYHRDRVIASFAGAFPASDPKYVMVVSLDEPVDRSGPIARRTAGWTAAPVFGAAVARLAPILGLRPIAPASPDDAPQALVAAAQ